MLLAVFMSNASAGDVLPPGYLARVNLNEPAEVEAILRRAENYYQSSSFTNAVPPVVIVLHGPEIEIFSKKNYSRYQNMVDLAAKLTAFEVLDVRICETRMAVDEIDREDLFPFVGTVPSGPDEIARLQQQQFVDF
jgi:intracellular sulfur oxidation DsrE/DsrF family protein